MNKFFALLLMLFSLSFGLAVAQVQAQWNPTAAPAETSQNPPPITPDSLQYTFYGHSIDHSPYKGKKIVIDRAKADFYDLLQDISNAAGKYIIVPDGLEGPLSLRLEAPWDQALDLLLFTRYLAYQATDDILTVCPMSLFNNAHRTCANLGNPASVSYCGPLNKKVFTPRYMPITLMNAELVRVKSGRGKIVAIGNDIYAEDSPAAIETMNRIMTLCDRPAWSDGCQAYDAWPTDADTYASVIIISPGGALSGPPSAVRAEGGSAPAAQVADFYDLLRDISDASGKHIIVPNGLDGLITVPQEGLWSKGLALISAARDLAIEETGDILTVCPKSQFSAAERTCKNSFKSGGGTGPISRCPYGDKKRFTPKYMPIDVAATKLGQFKGPCGVMVTAGPDIYVEDDLEFITAMAQIMLRCDRSGWEEGCPTSDIKRPAARSASYTPPPPILVISPGTVKRSEVRSEASSLKAPEGSGPYKGANISVEAKGLELETLLKKIAGSAGKTISVPDYELFNHQVTLKLEQRPWDETLEAILSLRGLGYEESGPTLTVCAASNFYAAQGLKECTRKPDSLNGNSSGGNEPLLANSFTVRHVPVDQAGAEMFRLKSGRGLVRIIGDDIFIKDTPEAVTAMTRLVNNLDNDYRPDSKTQAAQ